MKSLTLLRLAFCGCVILTSTGCGTLFDNGSPRIETLTANAQPATSSSPLIVPPSTKVLLVCTADDPENDPLTFKWTAQGGSDPQTDSSGTPAGTIATWTAPSTEGLQTVTCSVSDGRGGATSKSVSILVTNNTINHPPQATLAPASVTLAPNGTAVFTCTATDPDAGDQSHLTFTFFASAGSIAADASDKTKANYTAPATPGDYNIYCVVTDGKGGNTLAVATATVKAP